MFAELKLVVDLIRSSTSIFRMHKSEKNREQVALDLLKTYFLLKDCVEEGAKLIDEAGSDPIRTIKAMDELSADRTLRRWDSVLLRQSRRLSALEGFVVGQNHLAVISPDVQRKIKEIVSYKLERANSLHGIGAALLFRTAFPIANSDEERARYVSIMAGSESDFLDMKIVQREISALRKSLDQYRNVVERLLSDEEITRLSDKARKDTLFQDTPTAIP